VVPRPAPEQHLHHPQKQADADDHHNDREQPPFRPSQRDVVEPGRGQRRDRKIKRIDSWCSQPGPNFSYWSSSHSHQYSHRPSPREKRGAASGWTLPAIQKSRVAHHISALSIRASPWRCSLCGPSSQDFLSGSSRACCRTQKPRSRRKPLPSRNLRLVRRYSAVALLTVENSCPQCSQAQAMGVCDGVPPSSIPIENAAP
jgi:hypothetical protein